MEGYKFKEVKDVAKTLKAREILDGFKQNQKELAAEIRNGDWDGMREELEDFKKDLREATEEAQKAYDDAISTDEVSV